jgi:hypothetical protein
MLLTNGCRRRPCAGRDRDDLLCWRSEYGGLKGDQVKRLKETRENTRLRKAVAELTLDKLMLKETAKGNW